MNSIWFILPFPLQRYWLYARVFDLFFVFVFFFFQWFKGGSTNICYNCLDKNVEAGNGDKIAIYWEGNEPGSDGTLTYIQLLRKVCQVSCQIPHRHASMYVHRNSPVDIILTPLEIHKIETNGTL